MDRFISFLRKQLITHRTITAVQLAADLNILMVFYLADGVVAVFHQFFFGKDKITAIEIG